MARLTSIPSLLLVGPTAVGKTDVAHAIARRHGLGVVSADAMMVYRGMDVGTAKPTDEERAGLAYAGLDLTTPDVSFSVYDYLGAVESAMTRQTVPSPWMVAGGTGLYVRAILQGIDDDPGENTAFRSEADDLLSAKGFEALKVWCRARLPGIDDMMPAGDRDNPRRWIRAVERGGCRPVEKVAKSPNVCVIGLRRDKADLEQRIQRRVEAMYRGGLLEEVKALRQRFHVWSRTAAVAIGYAEAIEVLAGRLSQAEAVKSTVIHTRQYAKRQMTWFRNQLPTTWIDVAERDDVASVADRVVSYWHKHD